MLSNNRKINIDEIFRLYYRPLCLYALHYLHSTDDAEDVVQDCVTEFLERIDRGFEVDNVRSYLFMMVRNRSLDSLKLATCIDTNHTADEFVELIDESEYEEASFIEARLWTAIDSLPEKCREIFLLCKRDGLKYEEIAEELGVSINTVKNQVSKALQTLKNGCHKIYMFFFG